MVGGDCGTADACGVRALFSVLLFVSIASNGSADSQNYQGPYRGEVIRIIDGDTFVADVQIWPNIYSRVSIRLRGLDAPESYRPACGPERNIATSWTETLEEILPIGTEIVLRNVQNGKFSGRVVADVQRLANTNAMNINPLIAHRRGNIFGVDGIDWCNLGGR